jgi:ribosomal protein S18 acetylase RimI-like enzyme
MVTVRTLAADEWQVWRELRLEALADAPESFMSTHAEEAAKPDTFWQDVVAATAQHERGNLWIGEVDGSAVGQAFGRLDPDGSSVHVFAMWVSPEARGRGVGRMLLAAIVDWGRDAGATMADLWVTEGNEAAEGLYRRSGFEPAGERERLRDTGRFVVRLERAL